MGKWQEREDNSLDPIGLGKGKREKREGKERVLKRESTFSLDFSMIGPSNLGKTRGKVDPHCKGYA